MKTTNCSATAGVWSKACTGQSFRKVLWATGLVAVLSIEGCAFGKVASINVDGASETCDGITNVCGVTLNRPVKVVVRGLGVCSVVRVNFGDGQFIEGNNIDFGKTGATIDWNVNHTYQGWPGPKTMSAIGVTNCGGSASWLTHVFQPTPNADGTLAEDFRVAFGQPGPTACAVVPNAPALRKNTKVSIKTNPNPRVVINFGCLLGGCIHDADGEPNSSAPPNFPFPTLRKYSLVLRVGTQVVQGGTNMSFTTNQAGPLELCVNDDVLPDNTGAWGVFISVDESQAP